MKHYRKFDMDGQEVTAIFDMAHELYYSYNKYVDDPVFIDDFRIFIHTDRQYAEITSNVLRNAAFEWFLEKKFWR